jgi:two-component sensor histidine kinase
VRDVTELRRRERELMTKDATIREIHHRVKNNLQTVAALLRLQARRLTGPEAKAALDEAVRRVGSIAVVHETLSYAPEEIVDFDDIAERVAAMAGRVVGAGGEGHPGHLRAVRLAAGRGCHAARAGADGIAAECAAARPGSPGGRRSGGNPDCGR